MPNARPRSINFFFAQCRLELARPCLVQPELMGIVGRKVDLVSKRAIERSHNWIRRQEILETAMVIYVKE